MEDAHVADTGKLLSVFPSLQSLDLGANRCVCVCVCVYTGIYGHIGYAPICPYARICPYTLLDARICPYIQHICVYIRVYTGIYEHISVCVYGHIRAYRSISVCVYIRV